MIGQLFSKEWYGTVLSSVSPENATFVSTDKAQIFFIDKFLNKDKCNEIIKAFRDRVQPATTVDSAPDFRTSSTHAAATNKESFDLCVEIENKICETLNLSFTHSEGLEFEVFQAGQFYKAHTDWFNPANEEYQQHGRIWGQRTWTVQIWLSSPEKGGELIFPEIEEVKPYALPQGSLVAWNNLTKEGEVNQNVAYEHAPVIKGEKCLFTKFFRMKSLID